MELKDLRWALIVAQHRSLRQAAEMLNVRQSTLSRRLRDLEYRLGAELFERTNGGTSPTVAGLEFLETARRIIDETDAAFTRLKVGFKGERGHLTIGIYSGLSAGNLRATLIEHHRRFPDVRVRMVDGARHQLLRAVSTNAIDIAVMPTCGLSWGDRTLPLWNERLVVALSELHPLSSQSLLHWPELINEKFLLPSRGPGSELEHFIAIKLAHADPLQILRQDVDLDRLLSLVGVGYGAALTFEGAIGAHYPGVLYREVHEDDGPTRLVAVHSDFDSLDQLVSRAPSSVSLG